MNPQNRPTDDERTPLENTTRSAPPASRGNPAKRPLPVWMQALAPGLLVAVICGVFVSAFLWPMSQMHPEGIRLAVAGPDAQVSQIESALTAQQADLFSFAQQNDRDAAVGAIERRDVDGAVIVGERGTEFLTASAGNAQVTQILGQVATGMRQGLEQKSDQAIDDALSAAKSQGASAEQILAMQQTLHEKAQAATTVTVTDVVGGGNAFAGNLTMLPALIAGMMGGMFSMLMVKRPFARLITLGVAALGAGLIGATVLGPWFDMIPGSYWAHALALGLGALAISSVIAGLGTLFGPAGMGIGVALVLLIGTPWGGIMVPTEFLPGFMGTFGAQLPNGTVVSLMKSLSYFPDASTSGQWLTLLLWAAAGVVLLVIGAMLRERRGHKTA
ncbi:MAG: hypothetical protein ACTH93_08020 [Pseudoclavibacter sp.]